MEKMFKQLLRTSLATLALVGILAVVLPAGSVSAAAAPTPPTAKTVDCPAGYEHPKNFDNSLDEQSCCPSPSNGGTPTGTQCFVSKYLNPAINLLSAVIGIAIVVSIIIGGIQYSSSAGDPNRVAAARQRILSSLGGLAAFVFLWAFLQWVIPGGFLT